MRDRRGPLLVHLTSYRFAPGSHPGIYRTVLGLEGLATNVVLASEKRHGYADQRLEASARRDLAERGIHVFPDALRGVKKPWLARHLAVGVRRRFGAVTAVVGHLGNNGWRAVPLGRAADVPVVTVFHGTDVTVDLSSEVYGWRYRHLFEAPGAWFLAVADHLRVRLVRAGAPAERTATYHLGLDPGDFTADTAARARGPLRIVLVGRLIEVKGHRVALEAFRRLRERVPDARLHLFGEGPLQEALRGESAALGLGDAVRFRGVLPPAELRRELARAHMALQPSVRGADGSVEGVPNGILEAMASALPVVGSRHGGIPEAVVDGETGLLVPEGDPEALGEALLALAGDPPRRQALGAAGRRRVEKEFDLRTQGARLARISAQAAEEYRRLGRVARRRAWARACRGLVDTTGRRQQARYQLRILTNHVRGEIP